MLERDPGARLPAAAECYERGVSLCGMSKALGMPGIRIGWLATRDASLHPLLQRLHDYSTICSSAPSEVRVPSRNAERPCEWSIEPGVGQSVLAVLDLLCCRAPSEVALPGLGVRGMYCASQHLRLGQWSSLHRRDDLKRRP